MWIADADKIGLSRQNRQPAPENRRDWLDARLACNPNYLMLIYLWLRIIRGRAVRKLPFKSLVLTGVLLLSPLVAHSAGLGIKFYTGGMFPKSYANVGFIARHGSWNREKRFGYDVVLARTLPNGRAKIEPFMTGLLDTASNEFHGRPAYVFQLPDGSMLVSDEQNGAVYRISYEAPVNRAAAGK